MKVLVVGGAGYIGSHMAKMLVNQNHDVVILDNLSTGFERLAKYGQLVVGDLGDASTIDRLFSEHKFDAVMHFAAASLVGESVENPAKYYQNNVASTLVLLDAMRRFGVNNFIFSSTAATFGEPSYTPIDEAHPQQPINPYGSSKLMVEKVLQDYAAAYGLKSVTLRYFNACGADPEGELGECHDPETHLIPLVLQAASGRRKQIKVFGRDYATADGTCIRDYIHIVDLCAAHLSALLMLEGKTEPQAMAYNLGNGEGFSVAEIIDAAKMVVAADGKAILVEEGERRRGDPAVLIADATRARKELNWQPQYADIQTIIQHAWDWEKKQ